MKLKHNRQSLNLILALGLLLIFPVNFAIPSGQDLFATHCEACHGENGAGGVGVPLSLVSFLDSVDDDYLRKTILLGRPGRVMPSFSQLPQQEIELLVATLRSWGTHKSQSFSKTPLSGNSIQGGALYQVHCQACHGVDGRGGKGTGVTFSRERNLPIMAPSIINSGFLASASDTMIRDILINGRDGTPMVSFREQGLSDADINDIVVYLRSFENIKTSQIHEKQPPILRYNSDYSLDETVTLLKEAILGKNFRIIRTQYLEQGLIAEGKENQKQVILYFCNFKFLYDSLALDPRLGMFLPCRITVVETASGVSIMSVNPLAISGLFNNDKLNEACKKMRVIYEELMEDATL